MNINVLNNYGELLFQRNLHCLSYGILRKFLENISAVLLRGMAKNTVNAIPPYLLLLKLIKPPSILFSNDFNVRACGYQNRIGAQVCSTCGVIESNRTCPYCDTHVRLGQRCCTHCGRLTIIAEQEQYSTFAGLSINQGRYVIKRVLKNTPETKVLVALAQDTYANGQLVVLKRWPCIDISKDPKQYETDSEPLIQLRHPLAPRILADFIEEKNYYHVQTYMVGESLEERLQKLLKPLLEPQVIYYMNILLNILIALEQTWPPDSYRFCSITPKNIILDNTRDRVFLTGFQLPYRKTRKLALSMAFSPYMPNDRGGLDQRTLIYSLAACAHYALSNSEPIFGTPIPPIREDSIIWFQHNWKLYSFGHSRSV